MWLTGYTTTNGRPHLAWGQSVVCWPLCYIPQHMKIRRNLYYRDTYKKKRKLKKIKCPPGILYEDYYNTSQSLRTLLPLIHSFIIHSINQLCIWHHVLGAVLPAGMISTNWTDKTSYSHGAYITLQIWLIFKDVLLLGFSLSKSNAIQ